ncbi:hypothetical protein P59_199 [Bacillus phage P59]|nr:hypothetical protein P59_199 [Bacillus phage P59]
MKLNRRQLIMLLNSLAIQQDVSHAQVPERPKSTGFTKYAEANALALEEIQKGNDTMYFGELDTLFSMLVDECLGKEQLNEETDLADLPPTSQYLH